MVAYRGVTNRDQFVKATEQRGGRRENTRGEVDAKIEIIPEVKEEESDKEVEPEEEYEENTAPHSWKFKGEAEYDCMGMFDWYLVNNNKALHTKDPQTWQS